MKICHLTTVHSYKDTRIYLKECNYLSQYGYDTHLVAPNGPNKVIDGISVHGINEPNNKKNRIKRMTFTVKAVYRKAVKIDADIYHFHDPELIPIGLKLKRAGKKVIYDVHEDVPRQILSKHWINKNIRNVISKVFEKYENYAARKFDAIITATPHINKRFLLLGCLAKNVNNYPIVDELINLKVDWRDKERAVCYVGAIHKTRGLFEITDAIEKNDDVKLLLGGNFAKEREKEEVSQKNGWKKVVELGFLDRQQIAETFARSMAGLVVLNPTPSYVDSLPVKMFEYMAAGLPVISSDFPLWKSIIEKNNCGICVDPLDANKISNAIQWIVENPEEAQKMGENGRIVAQEMYNWNNEFRKLASIYNLLEK